MTKKYRVGTKAVHSGQEPDSAHRAINVPIYASANFVFNSSEQSANIFNGSESGYIYSRLSNPTVRAFENSIADLETGEDARAFASGMGAISAAVLACLKSGDNIVAGDSLYAGTQGLFTQILSRYKIGLKQVDTSQPSNIEGAIDGDTRLIYVESPSNPLMRLTDLAEVGKIGRERGIVTLADNTFMSPFLQRPLEYGIDVVVHSATKYLGGHSDVLGGVVVGSDSFIKDNVYMWKNHGVCLGPFEAWLILRGLKTLHIRMRAHQSTALVVAEFLENHPKVACVHYPGLSSHPQYDLARRQMDGFGGMLSFELKGGAESGRRMMNAVRLCSLAVSLGAAETLIEHPASMTHASISRDERRRAGIREGLVRLSVGLEESEDILEDIKQALELV